MMVHAKDIFVKNKIIVKNCTELFFINKIHNIHNGTELPVTSLYNTAISD